MTTDTTKPAPFSPKPPTVVDQNGARIVVLDHLDPESNAMVQALYSRAPVTVLNHIDRVAQVGPEKFMGSYYVGYGHKSIGDCGTTTVCLEQVSMLAAKAVQDWALYNGQEASTRYLDMSKQVPVDPVATKESKAILDAWMALYAKALETLVPFLKSTFPKAEDQAQNVYDKAINAKAFDIARSFLPAGATTYVSWHTNLRQAHDHLKTLEHHPLKEMRELGTLTRNALISRYPNSFSHKNYPTQEEYFDKAWAPLTYFHDAQITKYAARSRLDNSVVARYQEALATRPTKSELPPVIKNAGDIVFSFPLDFGSFRDLQRQRSVVCPMPLLTTEIGFHPWYLEQLPTEFATYARTEIQRITAEVQKLGVDRETLQYYIAMGYLVSCEVTASIPAAVYVAELRSLQTVHPTLRIVAQQMGDTLVEMIPGIAMYHDKTPDTWNIKRGTQDIVKKAA